MAADGRYCTVARLHGCTVAEVWDTLCSTVDVRMVRFTFSNGRKPPVSWTIHLFGCGICHIQDRLNVNGLDRQDGEFRIE